MSHITEIHEHYNSHLKSFSLGHRDLGTALRTLADMVDAFGEDYTLVTVEVRVEPYTEGLDFDNDREWFWFVGAIFDDQSEETNQMAKFELTEEGLTLLDRAIDHM